MDWCKCQGDIWQFTALTLQKAKLSDEPVMAKEDYTKFNSKDFKTVKVRVRVLVAYSWIPWLMLLRGDSRNDCMLDCDFIVLIVKNY